MTGTNQVKTLLLLGALTALVLILGQALGGKSGLLIAIVFAGGMNFFSYWFSDKIVLRTYNAQEITEADSPELYGIVRELAQRGQIPMPRVYIIPEETPNAFATGRNPQNAAVACTVGLMQMLDRRELAGVIGHELGHVMNRDTLIMTVAASLAGALGYLAQFAMFFGGRDEDDRPNPIALIVGMLVAMIAAPLVQMAISRSREFIADEKGARLTGDPLALGVRFNGDIQIAESGHLFIGPLEPRLAIGFVLNQTREPIELGDLERRVRAGEGALRGEITELGTRYRLATMYTSFVADPVAADDSLSPDRIRPGDPELRVRAPRGLAAVFAVLPWGEQVRCAWQPSEGVWLGRFLVPRGARAGRYRVQIYTDDQGTIALRTTLIYRVDDQAPRFALTARYAGGVLRLRAAPVADVFDPRTGDAIRDDRPDVRWVVVRVDGKDVPLARDGDAWTATVAAPRLTARTLTAISTDFAGNAATATAEVARGPEPTP